MNRIILLPVLLLLLAGGAASQGVPTVMSYQGYLSDVTTGQPVADGNYGVTFTIYDGEVTGGALWTESHSAVTVTKGLFSVVLGSSNPMMLTFDRQYWLGIRVGSEPEFSPRVRLTSSPYSFRAGVADRVRDGSITNASIADGANISASKLAAELVTESDLVGGTGVTVTKMGGTCTIAVNGAALSLSGEVVGPLNATTISPGAVSTAKLADNAVTNPKLANESVSTAKIQDNAVTGAKLATGAVGTAQIADNAVTAAKISPAIVSSLDGVVNDGGDIDLVAGSNITITPDNATKKITIASTAGGGLTLPYIGQATSTATLFTLSQSTSGTGRVAAFGQLNPANSTDAIFAMNYGTGTNADAVRAEALGGNAIEAYNQSSSAPTLYAYNSSTGPVALFSNSGTSAGDIMTVTKTAGSGKGLVVNYTGSTNAVYIDNNSTGTGLELRQDGSGAAAYFHIENTSNTNNALRAVTQSTSSSSDALEAYSRAGRALNASSGGSAPTISTANGSTTSGSALSAINSNPSSTVIAQNTSTTVNAPVLSLASNTAMVTTIDREGDISTVGNVTASGNITSSSDVSGDRILATTVLASTSTPAEGALYKNSIPCAWGYIEGGGSLIDGFGMSTSRTGTGTYLITFKNAVTRAAPIVTVFEETSPEFGVISSIGSTSCTVKIFRWSGTTFTLVDSVFFIVIHCNP